MDGVGNGIKQVGLAQTRLTVNKQRIIALGFSRGVGHRLGRRVGEFVGGADHKGVEGIFLGSGQKVPPVGVPLGLFSLSQYRYLDISGKKLPQGLLDIGQVAGGDDIPLKVRWGIKGQPVGGEGEGFGVVKPGIQGGGGKGTLHQ